ncbi:MAG: RluA family pseudouridine synthase [Lachnospiraceae bacterium]|nr:RluA family pseudouridine synthase [Lachnospiraceae bacterium]
MKEISVTNESAGQRLDKFLKRLLPSCPGSLLYKQLRKKNITLNGSKAGGHELLCEGDLIRVFFSDETYEKFSKGEKINVSGYMKAYEKYGKIEVVYSDKDIQIFNKPAGILSQSDASGDLSINDYLIGYLLHSGDIKADELSYFKPSVCNRLDRNTSGLILCSKSLQGARFLNKMLSERDAEKYYLALVKGRFDKEGIHTSLVKKDEKNNKLLFTDNAEEDSVEIKSGFEVLKAGDDASLLKVRLYTGKSHQIRAHLSHLGHPIVGDPKYGGKDSFGAKRQMLHAYELMISGESLGYNGNCFRADVPADMITVFKNAFGSSEEMPL